MGFKSVKISAEVHRKLMSFKIENKCPSVDSAVRLKLGLPIRIRNKKKGPVKGKIGKPRKYVVDDLSVGESKRIPMEYGNYNQYRNNRSVYNAINRQAKQTGMEFRTESRAHYILVIRTK